MDCDLLRISAAFAVDVLKKYWMSRNWWMSGRVTVDVRKYLAGFLLLPFRCSCYRGSEGRLLLLRLRWVDTKVPIALILGGSHWQLYALFDFVYIAVGLLQKGSHETKPTQLIMLAFFFSFFKRGTLDWKKKTKKQRKSSPDKRGVHFRRRGQGDFCWTFGLI